MDVTPEMRRAVYDEDCARLGHVLSFDNALTFDQHRMGNVAGPDGKQAHVGCRRCSKVWLIVEQPGDDYEAATVALDARMMPEHRRSPAVRVPKLP